MLNLAKLKGIDADVVHGVNRSILHKMLMILYQFVKRSENGFKRLNDDEDTNV